MIKNQNESTNLKIHLKNFGPIHDGEINVKPLTIFIGQNMSGKSYAAMLIYSLYRPYNMICKNNINDIPIRYFNSFFGPHLKIKFIKSLLKKYNMFDKQLDELKEYKEIIVPDEIIYILVKKSLKEMFEEKLYNDIISSYSCKISELVKINQNNFNIDINFNNNLVKIKSDNEKLKITKFSKLKLKIIIKYVQLSQREADHVDFKNNEIIIYYDDYMDNYIIKNKEKNGHNHIKYNLLNRIESLIWIYLTNFFVRPCYYLPAARSGILQGHKVLTASIVNRAPYLGVESSLEIPKFSGVISDFISSLIMLQEEKGKLSNIIENFEKEIINGEISLKSFEKDVVSEIKYNYKGTDMPLHRTSSTVSELAPLFIYLKYIIKENSILIIEEPEAHLHPKNQRILAHLLVKLIRNKINVIITTHSEYLLEQINNFILMSKIESKKRNKLYKYDENDYLESNEVAVYNFSKDNMDDYLINKVDINDTDGISDDEFLKVHENLYDESFKLQKYMNN